MDVLVLAGSYKAESPSAVRLAIFIVPVKKVMSLGGWSTQPLGRLQQGYVGMSEHRSSYQPNEHLFERRDYQVELSGSEDGDLHLPERFSVVSERPDNSSIPPVTTSTHQDMPPEFIAMMQDQQCLLQKLLGDQEDMAKTLKLYDKRVNVLEENVKKLNEVPSSSSSSPGGKKVLSPEISL